MASPVVMLHASQGAQQCYGALSECLEAARYAVKPVYLPAYAVGEDDIDTRDLIRLFDRALRQERLIDDRGKPGPMGTFSVISHSFGAVVVRLWMELYYPRGDCPVRHHIMLSPPNFGTRLAAAGRRMPDAIFNLGREILKDLELGSFFLWDLNTLYVKNAKPDQQPYPFVFAGLSPSDAGVAYPRGRSERESDGMVRAASANLNIVRVNRRGESQESQQTAFFAFPEWTHSGSRGLAGHIRSSGWDGDAVIERILQCLKVETVADYRGMCEAYYPKDLAHSQVIIRARDQYGRDVQDILADFFVDDRRCSDFILHTRSDSPYNAIAFYLNAKELKARAHKVGVHVSRRPYGHVHYGTGVQVPLFDRDGTVDRIRGGRTTMIEVMLTRSTRGVRFDPSQSRPTAGPPDLPRGLGHESSDA